MSFVRSRRLVGVLTVAMAAGVGIAGTSSPSMAGPNGPLMDIQILSFNDFHGNLLAQMRAPSWRAGAPTARHGWSRCCRPAGGRKASPIRSLLGNSPDSSTSTRRTSAGPAGAAAQKGAARHHDP